MTGLILGGLAGAALTLFLSSNKGKEMVNDLKTKSDDLQEDVKEKVAEFETAMESLLDKARKVTEHFDGTSTETVA
ncbi:MAG: YtxH domain-containing protein [Bacteroidetes bacterium]|nr:YtxH domain-containing protein [Bacteroidota bacterium]